MKNKMYIVDNNNFIYEKEISLNQVDTYISFIIGNINFYEPDKDPEKLKVFDDNDKLIKVVKL